MTSDSIIKASLCQAYDLGFFDRINPSKWAINFGRTTDEITSLMESVKADRATRLAPNAVVETMGEGK